MIIVAQGKPLSLRILTPTAVPSLTLPTDSPSSIKKK